MQTATAARRGGFGPPPAGFFHLLPVLIAVVQVVGTYFASKRQPEQAEFDALALALLAAGPVALAWRKRYPATVLGVVLATTLVYFHLDYPRGPIFFSLIVAFFSAVMAGRRTFAIGAVVIGYVGFLWLGDLLGARDPPPPCALIGPG